MIGIWSLLLSIALVVVTGGGAVLAFRSGHRVAIVLGLDAVLIAALGVLLNATTYGELTWYGLVLFGMLPVSLAAGAVLLSFKGRQNDYRYESSSASH